MRLVRYGLAGQERPGLIDADGTVRDLSATIGDLDPAAISPAGLKRLGSLDVETLPRVPGNPRFGVPVKGIGKFLAIGLNYADHAREANLPIPSEPPLFTKAISCLNGPDDEVMLPKESSKTDWEVEVGVIIGRTLRYVDERDALEGIAGYVLVNDISERAFQLERGSQWDKGKGCDTFGPVGPWLVTPDEIPDPQDIDLVLAVNGEPMQTGSTKTMIFPIRELVAYVSRFMTLYAGDLLITGTPAGVGMGRKPEPRYLKPGDEMHLTGGPLGEQRQRVVAWRDLGTERRPAG